MEDKDAATGGVGLARAILGIELSVGQRTVVSVVMQLKKLEITTVTHMMEKE
jgi:hypothetical protein